MSIDRKSGVSEMRKGYLRALIDFEKDGENEWSAISVEDVAPETRDHIDQDCRLFLGQATSVTGLRELDDLLRKVKAADMGYRFFLRQAETELGFDRPEYAGFGPDLDKLADRFGHIHYCVVDGQIRHDARTMPLNIGPPMIGAQGH